MKECCVGGRNFCFGGWMRCRNVLVLGTEKVTRDERFEESDWCEKVGIAKLAILICDSYADM